MVTAIESVEKTEDDTLLHSMVPHIMTQRMERLKSHRKNRTNRTNLEGDDLYIGKTKMNPQQKNLKKIVISLEGEGEGIHLGMSPQLRKVRQTDNEETLKDNTGDMQGQENLDHLLVRRT